MLTIHHLEVRLDVEGEGDDAAFARLFDKYIRMWHRRMEEARARQRLADAHRALGNRTSSEGE